jgi:hypothetical protein
VAIAKAPNVDIAKEVAAAAKALAPAAKRLASALQKLDPEKLPFGAASDLLYQLRAVVAMVPNLNQPFDDVLSPAIKTLNDHFINSLAVGESSGVQGMTSRTQVTDNPVPVIAEGGWPKFYAHVKKTGEFELLNRALNRAAIKERWEARKQVPGVTVFHDKRVSCTKLSAGRAGPPKKAAKKAVKK